MSGVIRQIEARATEAQDLMTFLRRLDGPTWIRIPGKDRDRTRAVTTLLHGNEPSGLRALYAMLFEAREPAVDLVCFVGNVAAALAAPPFTHRMLPERRDLNRCFRPPFEGPDGRVAAELLDLLRDAEPEALLDLHNSSGSGPAYGVATGDDEARRALTALFSKHMIVTDLRLGALMEAVEDDFPTVTIECGGARDDDAHRTAALGLAAYASGEPLPATRDVVVLPHPLRVELAAGCDVAYADGPVAGVPVTLRADVDRHNFDRVPAGETLGWLGPSGADSLQARDTAGHDHLRDLFDLDGDRLIAREELMLFMATTTPEIARTDCLFYVLAVNTAADSAAQAEKTPPSAAASSGSGSSGSGSSRSGSSGSG